MISAYASLRHFHDHLSPIFDALPADLRGECWSPGPNKPWGTRIPRSISPGLVMVAGYADHQRMAPAPTILVEHGSGQQYGGDPAAAKSGSYAGGDGLERVRLFLAPSERVAQLWRDRYPNAEAVAVGCPRLDRHHAAFLTRDEGPRTGSRPTVAITTHWDLGLLPETTSALSHFAAALPALRDAVRAVGGDLLGHGHPRAARRMRALWGRLGVRYEPDLDEVLRQADVLVVDNSSAGPEAAACGIPVCWVSAPWYRRDVVHHGRFWEWPRGQVHVEEPADLVAGVFEALRDPPEVRAAREAMVRSVYVVCDGRASERAADAIVRLAAAGT